MNPLLSEREITVTLEVKIKGTINDLQICENFPPGWILISSDPTPQTPYPYQLLWTLEIPENRTLTYVLRYPQESQGSYVFWGSYEYVTGDIRKNEPISGARTVIITVLTPTPIPTFTHTPIPTATNTFIPTSTDTATVTPTTTFTPTQTCTQSPTPIPTATMTPSPSPTRTVTATSPPTATPSHTATATRTTIPTSTFSPTPSRTATSTAAYTRTHTPTPSRTSTNTPKPIDTPTLRPSATQTPIRQPSWTPTTAVIPTFTSTASSSPTATQTSSYTATKTPTSTYSPTWTRTSSPTSIPTQRPTDTPTYTQTVASTPSRTATKTVSPTRTPSRTPTRKPSPTPTMTPTRTATVTATFTFTPSATFSPTPSHTPTPSPKPPTLSWTQKLPELKAILNQPAYRLLDLDDYWSATTTEPTSVRWRVNAAGTSFGIKLDSENRLSILNPHSVGTYAIDLQGNDGIHVLRTKFQLKISHFIFRSAHHESLIILQPNERYRSPDSLYSRIDPHGFPPEQIRFDFNPALPAGIKSVGIDPDGHYWIEADGSASVDLSGLLIKANHISPTPTIMPSSTPTPAQPLTTPTPAPAPEIEFNACAQPIRFRQVHTETVGRDPVSLQSADLNRDNRPDWITADYGENTATLLLSNGDGLSYQPYKLYAGEGCLAVELGDWNQDGWMDAALLGGYDSLLTIYHSSRGRSFTKAAEIPLHPDPILPQERMEKGHFRIMACGHFAPNSPSCLLVALVNQLVSYEYQNRQWKETNRQLLENSPLDLMPLDADGDGIQELALTFNNPSRFCLYKHSQEGWKEWRTFDLNTPLHGNYAQTILAGRLNHDSCDDAALITFDSTLRLFLGGTQPRTGMILPSPWPIVIHDFTAGDFDGNGSADLLWMGFDVQRQNTALNLLCGGANGFSNETASVALPWPYLLNQKYSLAASDFDADGRLDLVLSDDRENRLIFLKNIPAP